MKGYLRLCYLYHWGWQEAMALPADLLPIAFDVAREMSAGEG